MGDAKNAKNAKLRLQILSDEKSYLEADNARLREAFRWLYRWFGAQGDDLDQDLVEVALSQTGLDPDEVLRRD